MPKRHEKGLINTDSIKSENCIIMFFLWSGAATQRGVYNTVCRAEGYTQKELDTVLGWLGTNEFMAFGSMESGQINVSWGRP